MARAPYALEVDFDGDGDFSSPYDDVTRDVRTVECKRGRDYASQLTGRATAGRLIAELKNTDGKYSSFNSSSPIFGNIIPGRKVRLRIKQRVNIEGVTQTPDADLTTINVRGLTQTENPSYVTCNVVGVTQTPDVNLDTVNIVGLTDPEQYDERYPTWYAEGVSEEATVNAILWTGWLDRIVPGAAVGSIPTVTLEATGSIGKLNGKEVTPPAQANKTTGVIIGAILDNADWPAGDRDIDTGQTTISRWYVDRKDALNAIREIEETELGFFYENEDGGLVFEDRHARLRSPHTVSQATFSDQGTDVGFRGIEQADPLREIFNEVIATIAPLQAELSASVLWTLREASSPTIEAGGSLTVWAEYPNPEVDPENGAYVETWTTPVVGTDITQTGVSNGDLAVTADKFASAMKITITNNHASSTATITLLQARGVPVKRREPVRVTAEDATSQTNFGIRTYRLPGPWLPNVETGQDFANYVLSRYKDPLPVLSLTFLANRDSDAMEQALTRTISDRITVEATGDQTQLGINGDFFIEAITHRIIQAGTRHEVTFDLSQAEGDAGYWVVGVSELGISTRLAF